MRLQWADVDLKAGRVLVRRPIYRGELDSTKGGWEREVPLNDRAIMGRKLTEARLPLFTLEYAALMREVARHWAPSTSDVKPAGIKWHALVSLKDELPVAERMTEQRMHDSVGLPDEALAPGTLTLFDPGYVDVERFIAAIERGAHFLTRLKTNHNPMILRVRTGKGDRVQARGMRLDEALTQGVLGDEAGAVDLDVQVEAAGRLASPEVASSPRGVDLAG